MENDDLKKQPDKTLFSQVEIDYSRSRQSVWAAIESQIEQAAAASPATNSVSFAPNRWLYMGAAAAVVLAFSLGLFAKFYTTQVNAPAGELLSHTLPDGSAVHLNAVSSLAYAPYWWWFDRSVQLNGEAFFEVEKGSKFSVNSPQGTTQVLGTSFNVYARDTDYQVYCKTGKVEVIKQNHVILTPGEFAFHAGGQLVKETRSEAEEAILSWQLKKFIYNTTPLSKVLADLKRHYNIELTTQINNIGQYHYTGLFSRTVSVEEALKIVSFSFDFTFEKVADHTFVLKEKQP